MFTGIVEELGHVMAVAPRRLAVRAGRVSADVAAGHSVAVNGVCLTVTTVDRDVLGFDVLEETLARSSLGAVRPGDGVNLERAVTPSTRLGGHLVQGHVDATAALLTRDGERHRVALPPELARYVVEKGSIAVDGVSLTVAAVDDHSFTVALIPETLARTTLGGKAPGDPLNLEVDVLAKYVERLLAARP
jgi:riboflavin synthase